MLHFSRVNHSRNLRLAGTQILALGLFFCWASIGTGLATDDFVHLNNAQRTPFVEMLLPTTYLSVPVLHYTHALAYALLGNQLWGYDILKGAYLLFALFASARFLTLFASTQRAWCGAIILILCPLHDGATLWLTGQYLILSLGLYLMAYVSAREGRTGRAALLALLASFSSYGSPPLAVGLTLMLLLARDWRGALALVLPNAAYIVYYIVSSMVFKAGTARLPAQFDVLRLLKSYFAQVASFADATLGPSAWLKFALSLASLSALSALVAALAAIALWHWAHGPEPTAPRNSTSVLVLGTLAISLAAFGVFSLTGIYPQVAFNLGDRVVIYGMLFLTALLVRYASQRVMLAAASVTLFAFMGIAEHWKGWNGTTQGSISQIRAQLQSGRLVNSPNQTLYVSGLQYSRLGPMTHIDHFTSAYVIREILTLANEGRPTPTTVSFNRRLQLQGDFLVDVKYGDRHPVGVSILVYDAERNAIEQVTRADIPARIAALPQETRHWTQLLGPGIVRDTILWLMPSLRYAYS